MNRAEGTSYFMGELDTMKLSNMLNNHEFLGIPEAHMPTALNELDLRRTLGYEIYPIEGTTGSMLIAVMSGGAVEPRTVNASWILKAEPLSGEGKMFVRYRDDEAVRKHSLDADNPNSVICYGTAYGFINPGHKLFVVRLDFVEI